MRVRAVLVLAASLSGSRTLAAEPCAPRVALDGDAAAIARVAAELGKLGDGVVEPDVPDACPAVSARVRAMPGGTLAVAIVDGARTQEVSVSDAAVAAAWLDSWLHDEPLVHVAPPAPVAVVAAPAPAPARASSPERWSLTLDYAPAFSDGGGTWTGGSIGACARVGALCLGGRAAYGRQTLDATMTAGVRGDASLLATASAPIALGRTTIWPELGLGAGRMTTTRHDADCLPPGCDPADPVGCMPDSAGSTACVDASGRWYVGDKLDHASYTPRASAALRIAVPLFDRVSLDAFASAVWAPFGHGDAFATAADPATGLPSTSLPGEPHAIVQLGVGLRVGVP